MRGLKIAELFLLAALWGGSFLFMRIAAPGLIAALTYAIAAQGSPNDINGFGM